MEERITLWVTNALVWLALLLLVFNIALADKNRGVADDITRRQDIVAKGERIAPTNRALVQAMAEMAVKNKNDALRAVLAGQGITVKAPEAPVAESPATTKNKAGKP